MQTPVCLPPIPLFLRAPASAPPQRPNGSPPARHVCRAPPLRNRGTLGGARKVRPPFPLVTAPLMRIGSERGTPPPPFVPRPPAPVYARTGAPRLHPTVYGDGLPNPLPSLPPLMCEGRGGAHGRGPRKCGQPQTPHPTPFSPFTGEQGGMGGRLGLATRGHVRPLSPRKWGVARTTGTARAPVHPLLCLGRDARGCT